ncbi:UBX domain-containing protein 4 [Heterocephalus glaber]|uniref:UBX domain-containing protein 4 n=1 Tax=Heterocephalus glaber TaxID=10181 RepID=G5B1T0_HETGA|nr:UBX domain-containing protein 4 [Heterocephalus glaber]
MFLKHRLTKKLEERREEKRKEEEQDRAERAARFAKTKEEVEAAKAAALLAKQAEMEGKRESYARERREPVRKRVLEKRGEDFKKEGKIYRLRTQDDGEDENNTWNGNSTQQM